MKILCVIESLEAGGAQRQLVNLALSFQDRGAQVEFLTYHHIPFYLPVLESVKISYVCISPKNYLKRVWLMRRHIRRGQYDAVLAFLETPSFICSLAGLPSRRWRLVVGERNANPKILTSLRSKLLRIFHLFADNVVSNSHENLRMVKKINPLLGEKKCKVIYNMVDFHKWAPSPDYTFDKKKGFISIIVIGRHVKQKNLNGLVEAVYNLPRSVRSQLKISWYGDKIVPPYYDDTYPEALKAIGNYNLHDIFSFFPATPNIVEKVQEADVVALFSVFEGFPNVICEGMACAKPVIVGKVSDLPLIVEDPDMSFNPNDPSDISRVLNFIVCSNASELMEKGRRNRIIAMEKFSQSRVVDEYLNLLAH